MFVLFLAIFQLFHPFVNPVKTDDFDPTVLVLEDDIVAALFPKKCASGESWKDEKSSGLKLHCTYQKGDFAKQLNTYASDAESLGCKVDKGIAKYMADNFGNPSYASSPIYARIGEDCGFCGHKPACCGVNNAVTAVKALISKHPEIEGASPFYFQSLTGQPCSKNSNKVCSVKPLTSVEFDQLAKLQPFTKNIDRSDGCNFGQFGLTEWEAARNNPSYPVGAPLLDRFLCRSTQTIRPRFNCVKNPTTGQCMCCCNSYSAVKTGNQYSCVQKNDKETEKICATI